MITNHVLENFVVTNHIHENFVIVLIKSLGGEMENEWLVRLSTDQKIQIQYSQYVVLFSKTLCSHSASLQPEYTSK